MNGTASLPLWWNSEFLNLQEEEVKLMLLQLGLLELLQKEKMLLFVDIMDGMIGICLQTLIQKKI